MAKKITYFCCGFLMLAIFFSCHKSSKIPLQKIKGKVAPAQASAYPHSPKWALRENHGAQYVKSKEACMHCHVKDNVVSCDACHLMMPHGEEFKTNHPDTAKDYKGQCGRCHTDYKRLLPNIEGGCLNSKCHSEGTLPVIRWRKP